MTPEAARRTSFGYRFAMIHRIDAALVREPLSQIGITIAQIPFLMELLYRAEPLTQSDLSNALAIDPAATARTLDQLEKRGYIAREVNPENRRQKLVTATANAEEMHDDLKRILLGASNALVEEFTEEEKALLLKLLDRIIAKGRTMKKAMEENRT